MAFLEPERYVGVEPNVWLLAAAIDQDASIRSLVNTRKPVFLCNEDFDAAPSRRTFDFLLSHSILSHAADWQLDKFMASANAALAPNGIGIVSIRFTDEGGDLQGNSYDKEWVYPGNSFFSPETVASAAEKEGLACEWVKEYREIVSARAPTNFHDWIRLSRPDSDLEPRS